MHDDRSTVVFLHGTPTTSDVMAKVAERVSPGARTVLVASPGYGGTPALAPGFRVSDVHDALAAMLAEQGVERPWIVGFSGGGYHALALALRPALGVRGVTVLAGIASLDDADRAGFRGFADALLGGADLRDIAGPRFLSETFRTSHPERVRDVEAWLDATTRENLAAELRAFAEAPDLLPSLAALTIPVVARVGSEDLACPLAKSEAIVKACPRARLEVVHGKGHALPYEDEEGTAESIVAAACR